MYKQAGGQRWRRAVVDGRRRRADGRAVAAVRSESDVIDAEFEDKTVDSDASASRVMIASDAPSWCSLRCCCSLAGLRRARRRRRRHEHLGRQAVSGGYLVDGARLPDHGDGFMTREVWIRARQPLRHRRAGRARSPASRAGCTRRSRTCSSSSPTCRRAAAAAAYGVPSLAPERPRRRLALLHARQRRQAVRARRDARVRRPRLAQATAAASHRRAAHVAARQGAASPRPRRRCSASSCTSRSRSCCSTHAEEIGEPPELIARARRALHQPGDSARHDDHMHVRVYCSEADRAYGCVDMGPMELLAAARAPSVAALAARRRRRSGASGTDRPVAARSTELEPSAPASTPSPSPSRRRRESRDVAVASVDSRRRRRRATRRPPPSAAAACAAPARTRAT